MTSHTDHRHTQSTHMNTDSTNGLILLPSLAEWDGGPIVRKYIYMYICTSGSLQQLDSNTLFAQ